MCTGERESRVSTAVFFILSRTSIVDGRVPCRNGERTGGMDGTNGGGDVDSKRVKAARLAANGQYMRNDART